MSRPRIITRWHPTGRRAERETGIRTWTARVLAVVFLILLAIELFHYL